MTAEAVSAFYVFRFDYQIQGIKAVLDNYFSGLVIRFSSSVSLQCFGFGL